MHLAGESVLGLWTRRKRQAIRDSRVLGTRAVVDGIKALADKPALVSASAIGYYGDTGDRQTDESHPPGDDFLASVSVDWEAEAVRAGEAGARVAILRIGFVLAPDGGAMSKLKPVFRLGLGGRLGSGRQWMSLVHVDDVAGMALWAAQSESVAQPLNCVLPEPLRNADFTRRVARLLRRPAFFHVPAPLLRLAAGDLSRLFLASQRIVPARASAAGYRFAFPAVQDALADSVGVQDSAGRRAASREA